MVTRIKVSTSGLESFLEDIAKLGLDVDEAVHRALRAGAAVAKDGLRRRVPKDTHNLEFHLHATEVKQEGNTSFVLVGVMEDDGSPADAETARYANSQEYGTSSMAAQPYVRPTIEEDKGAIKKAMRDELKGVLGE